MNIVSWSEARKQKLKKYFTGKPCNKGHIAERFSCNGVCVECHLIRSKKTHRKYYDTPEGKYRQQRLQAKQRGVEWLFTLDNWKDFWGEKLAFRGVKQDELCCCRYNDEGPYSPQNCYIDTNGENLKHYRTQDYPRRDENGPPTEAMETRWT